MRSPWIPEGSLNPRMLVLGRDRRREGTEESPSRNGGRNWKDVAASPGCLGLQELEEAGRMLPKSLWRQRGPVMPHPALQSLA